MNNRGQFSFVWLVLATGLAIAVFMGLWIIVNESQTKMHDQAILNGVNVNNLVTLENFLYIAPFAVLAGWAINVWTTAAATQGGDYIGP